MKIKLKDMENKLTLREIAPYLPYGLQFATLNDDTNEYYIDANRYILNFGGLNGVANICMANYSRPLYKIILRPLSDLTKEIEINGKRFTPLIELYRCSNEYNYNEDLDYEFIDSWGAKGNILKVFHNRKKNEYTEFVFSKLSFRKDRIHSKGSYVFGMNLPHNIRVNSKLYNNHKLYNLLYIWHFDIFGLIEKGLAIDINTL